MSLRDEIKIAILEQCLAGACCLPPTLTFFSARPRHLHAFRHPRSLGGDQ